MSPEPAGCLIKMAKVPGSDARAPTQATPGSACWDVYSAHRYVIGAGMVHQVDTGLCVEIPPGWAIHVLSRSGMASRGVWVANAPGVIDSDYRGELKVLLYNSTGLPVEIRNGDRIAQLQLVKVEEGDWAWCDTLSETSRGTGGLGSTGK